MRRALPIVAGLVVGVVVALAVLLPGYVGLDRATPFTQLAALTPPLLVVVMASAFVGRFAGVLVRRKGPPLDERRPRLFAVGFAAMMGAAVVGLTTAGIVGSRLLADDPPPTPPGSPELAVLSLNVDHGGADVAAVAALVRERRADLVVLPEAGDAYRARLLPLLPGYRGYSAPATEDGGSTTLLSTVDLRVTPTRGALFGSLEATLPDGTRLVAVHTAAPVPGQVPLWRADLERLVAPHCAAPGGAAVLVAGDLNATADQRAFRAAAGGCTDALPSVGAGTVATFPTNLPRWFGVQIDHVLVNGGPTVTDAEVLDVPGTDHRALLARIVVPGR
ncbi:endonuclease/exonuclease/phosphatase family protein [Actinomycetospora atypica]|uniref:Endonuclease/exonuclease/phosphatase family protein n=1 Tax=Actinomycetospora atypica TaxID=1290095 RepID=A0ABV9YIA2_9PSEU